MLQKLLFVCMFVYAHSMCSVSHEELWSCALKKNPCMNKYQLHKTSTLRSGKMSLARPFILAIEGPQYHKLFEDCDANSDGCISLDDIQRAGDVCKRSCIWRSTMKTMLC